MADTFGTCSFTLLFSGVNRTQASEVAVHHIPFSDTNYIDLGGMTPLQIDFDILLATDAAYQDLEAKVGGTASLVTDIDGTIGTAALVQLSRTKRVEPGYTFASATFMKAA